MKKTLILLMLVISTLDAGEEGVCFDKRITKGPIERTGSCSGTPPCSSEPIRRIEFPDSEKCEEGFTYKTYRSYDGSRNATAYSSVCIEKSHTEYVPEQVEDCVEEAIGGGIPVMVCKWVIKSVLKEIKNCVEQSAASGVPYPVQVPLCDTGEVCQCPAK